MKNPYFSHGLGYSLDNNISAVSTDRDYYPYEDLSPITITSQPTVQNAIPKPIATTPITIKNQVNATMTLKTLVADTVGVLPLATVSINNDKFSTTETGVFQKTGIGINDIVTITYVGYKPFTAKASDIPAKVILQEASEQLNEVVIITPKTTNWLAWLAVGTVGAVLVREMTKKSTRETRVIQKPKELPKTVKAKI
ncbi:hypothetical protein [Flavobacterium sp.]|uniref:hypothetical protein n=1 Tax=Flavobacterium sp. TaxID=239 RepID=UPI00391A98AE